MWLFMAIQPLPCPSSSSRIQVTCQIVPAERLWPLETAIDGGASLEYLGIDSHRRRIDSMIPSAGMGPAAVSTRQLRSFKRGFEPGRNLETVGSR